MQTNNNWIVPGIILALIVVGGLVAMNWDRITGKSGVGAGSGQTLITFFHPESAMAFNYPDTYELNEQETGTTQKKHYTIVLTSKTADPAPENSEGAPTITIDIFKNVGTMPLEDWITKTDASNYKLAQEGTSMIATKISGLDAQAYTFDGLYSSTAFALKHETDVVMFTEGHLTPEDQIRKDFATVVASVQFDPLQ